MANGPIVSSESDLLILVDQDDNTVGFLDKAACHDGKGVLHRAFSVFLLNSQGEILLQRRSLGKRLWGGFWSNSCCSHPRRGESVADAAKRRCQEELGIKVELQFLYNWIKNITLFLTRFKKSRDIYFELVNSIRII